MTQHDLTGHFVKADFKSAIP